MNRERLSRIAHTGHPVKAPVDDPAVARLLGHALPSGGERVLDLGCGGAEWLLRALAAYPDLRAEGVDLSADALDGARRAAAERGLADRLTLHHRAAGDFSSPEPFDTVVSVAASHAFGGLLPTLEAARAHLAPGGRVLVGEGYWEREPTPEAVEMLGPLSDLAGTVEQVAGAGWVPVQGHISTRAELDAYEWACWGSLAAWALDHPGDPESAEVLETAATRRTQWLRGYRDAFGFVFLVLRRADRPAGRAARETRRG